MPGSYHGGAGGRKSGRSRLHHKANWRPAWDTRDLVLRYKNQQRTISISDADIKHPKRKGLGPGFMPALLAGTAGPMQYPKGTSEEAP